MNGTFIDCLDSVPGDAIALIDDARQLTYGEVRQAAQQIAGVLHDRWGTGKYVVLRARSDIEFVTSLLGIMYSGNTPVPINPELSEADVQDIQKKSRAAHVLDPIDHATLQDRKPIDRRDAAVPSLILFTSGTSGHPKGVIISHSNLVHSCAAISRYLDYDQYRSAAVVLPLHYSYALLSQVYCQLFVGGRVRLFGNFRNPIRFSQFVNEGKLETFCGVPSTFHALVAVHRMRKLCMPGIRVLCSAGAAMDRSKFNEVKEIFPNALFFNNYGMTEAAPRISHIREDDPRFFEPTCGRPMEGVDVKIVDPETRAELPDGQPGVLVVRGPNVTSGYLNDERLTAEAFTEDGYLISGDIAYKDQGYIFICGRHDDIFNVGGEKVAPLEVERVLNLSPGIDNSAVVGVKDEQRGMVPVAFLKIGRPLSRKEILVGLDGQLPKSKVPQRFFEVRSFPMTPNGKLQRRRLSMDDSTHVIREIL